MLWRRLVASGVKNTIDVMVRLGSLAWGSTSLEEKWSGTVPGLPNPPSTFDRVKDHFADKIETLVVSDEGHLARCH